MILLAAIAFRLVGVPVTDDYAYRMLAELTIEIVVLYTPIVVGLWQKGR